MQYEERSGKAILMASPYTSISHTVALTEDREIRRTRKIVLIIVGVCLVVAVLGTINAIAGNEFVNHSKYNSPDAYIGQSLISVVFLSFGYLVAYRYSQRRLQMFDWLKITALIIVGVGLALLFFFRSASLDTASSLNDGQGQAILVGLSIIAF
ncbi:unnamed protein product [Rotaria magnacalcarata]|uniref:Uncharacterized protein n=1 Tax=Rotaria magnacalcarata TaxID=392030 RepID=A0A8S2KNA2_9BILA|nr:unnamed protein product [Rotaria magnacalcarata]